jgi:type IV pilus assembly protein PilN
MSLVITGLALAAYGWHLRESRTTLVARSLAVDTQLATITASATRLDRARKRQTELVAELARIRLILDDRTTSTELFEAISRSLTDGLWLTEVKRSASMVQVDGRAASLAAIAGLVRNLGENLSFVRPPEIRSMATEGLEGSSVLRFQIAGELAPVTDEGRP